MTLSKQRQAIVKEFEDKWGWDVSPGVKEGVIDYLTQALSDYTESIIRMVEGEMEDEKGQYGKGNQGELWDAYDDGHNSALKNLLEELNK